MPISWSIFNSGRYSALNPADFPYGVNASPPGDLTRLGCVIQREKIAALGHLIAGIAHEINTPLGAIRASITNISHALEHSLDYLPRLFQTLSPERQADFLALLQASLAHKIVLSSREARQKRRDM